MPRGGPAGWRSVEGGQHRVTVPAGVEVTAGYPRTVAQVGRAAVQVGGPAGFPAAVSASVWRARDGSHSTSGRGPDVGRESGVLSGNGLGFGGVSICRIWERRPRD
ncbi:hypothetical protein GCM10027360_60550 [Amycolatopsis echigonensis]